MKSPPEQKRGFRQSRWYRPLLLVTTFLALIPTVAVVLAFPVSNHLVHRDWVDFRTSWEARGEIFDLDQLLDTAVPDDENFAKAPIIEETYREASLPQLHADHDHSGDHQESHEPEVAGSRTRLASIAVFNFPDQARMPQPKPPLAYASGKPIDLRNFLPENFPDKTTPKARDHFEALFDSHEPIIAELMEAASRPDAYFVVNRDKPSATRLSHLPDLILALHSLHLHNITLINLDRSELATERLIGTLRTIRHGTDSPGLASFSIRSSALELGPIEAIWQALFRQNLNSTQWAAISDELETFQFGPQFLNSLRFERAALIRSVESQFEEARKHPFAAPPAWVPVSSLLEYGELTQRFWFTDAANGDPLTARPLIGQLATIESQVASREASMENIVLATGVIPAAEMAIQSDRVQIQRDHALIAIAIERYRLDQGVLPDRLSLLVPRWLPEIPVHPVTGLPPRYERPALPYRDTRPDEYRLRALGDTPDATDPIWVMPHRTR